MYSPKNEGKFVIMTKNFYKNNDRNREKPTSVIKRRENYEFYALIRVADEFEDGTKPI